MHDEDEDETLYDARERLAYKREKENAWNGETYYPSV